VAAKALMLRASTHVAEKIVLRFEKNRVNCRELEERNLRSASGLKFLVVL
jgi:hypothetical protein